MPATAALVELLRGCESFLRAWDAWQRLTARGELSIGIRHSLAYDVFNTLEKLDHLQNDDSASECDASAYLIFREKVPVLLGREVNYLPKDQQASVQFDIWNPFRFSAESIELLRHAADLIRQQIESPKASSEQPRDALETAFKAIITSNALPSLEAFLELGRQLREARLNHFIGEFLGNGSTHADRCYGLLASAARHLTLIDFNNARSILERIADSNEWPHARDELVKFYKAVWQELKRREIPALDVEEPAGESDGTKKRNRERDAEVVRLKQQKPRLTNLQIAKLICKNVAWAEMENGKPFNAHRVRSIWWQHQHPKKDI